MEAGAEMGRPCTVCAHKDLKEINKLLICSGTYREITRKYGLSKDALSRHKENHMPELLLKSQDAKETLQADNLLDQIMYYESEARRYKELAESQGDLELALKSVDRALKCLDLFAKARGIISDAPQINVLVAPQWIELRTVIIQALEPFPRAREAVVHALNE